VIDPPRSEEALAAALADGFLIETHHLDLKADLPPGAKANRELAKDIAAMGIDGGALYIGVDEGESGQPPSLTPVALAGLKERVDQVARSACSPPVSVRAIEIPAAAPGLGYLVVIVPPQPEAPHMVDGRYRGRSDTTSYVLDAAEVVRLHERRTAASNRTGGLLDDEIRRDPAVAAGLDAGAHLFVVAQPVTQDDELLLRAVPDGNLRSWIGGAIVRGVPGENASFSPNISGMANQISPRARGAAAHTYCVTDDRTVQPNGNRPAEESDLLDVEVHEDGGVRLFCSRATDSRHERRLFITPLVFGLTRAVVRSAGVVAATADYVGSWDFGVAITNLRGAIPSDVAFDALARGWAYSEETYRGTTRATFEDLHSDPDQIVDRLLGRLARAMQIVWRP
jgi:hypothetical protein